MQAVLNHPSALDGFRFAGGRSYMMRSEKRSPSGPVHRSPVPDKKPPRRKRRKAGFFYKLFMMLLLLTIWPVGLLLLWRRKVRWGTVTKLLTSIVTLAACIVLIGFALTVNTGNDQYTAVQDSVNSFLDEAADILVDAGDIIAEKAEIIREGMDEVSGAFWETGKVYLADGIDAGVLLAQRIKTDVTALLDSIAIEGVETETETPEAEPAPIEEEVEASDAAQEDESPETTDAPEAAEVTANTDATSLPIFMPESSPEAQDGRSVAEGTLTRAGALVKGEVAPTVEPSVGVFPTATLDPLEFTVKSAADATVFYNDGGKCYHKASACASMKTSVEHTMGDTLDVKNRRCTICGTPDKTILDETHIVWTDAENIAHLSDECAAFSGMWNLITAAEANEKELTACAECSADLYLRAVAAELDVVIHRPEPSVEPTEEPTEEPTTEPTKKPTKKPTAEPTAESTEEPAGESAGEPTAKPTKKPTAKPTVKASPKATEKPVSKSTVKASAKPAA